MKTKSESFFSSNYNSEERESLNTCANYVI